jgi:hypothetical protein
VQLPALTAVTVVPKTVQTLLVLVLNDTGSPDDAIAETVVLPPGTTVVGEKLRLPMVCSTFGVTEALGVDAAPVPKLLVALTLKL